MGGAIKRKLIQIAAFGLSNPVFSNFANGTIYKGPLKAACVPGLNCYSCPGAVASCPIGSLQAVMGSNKFDFSFYVVGILLALGIVLGRFICGFLCPFGLLQEGIHKIPSRKLTLWKPAIYFKYAILAVFVIILPLTLTNVVGIGQPAFCQYICPAGTLEGGIPLLIANPALRSAIGDLFALKLSILIGTLIACLFVYRFFCRVLCPLGAIYGLFNRISIYRLRWDDDACTKCGACAKVCKMGVDPSKDAGSAECIRCGDCVRACPKGSLKMGFGVSFNKKPASENAKCGSCKTCGHCTGGAK